MMNEYVFRQTLSSLAEEAIPTKPDAWRVFSAKLDEKHRFRKSYTIPSMMRRRPGFMSGAVALVLVLLLLVIVLSPHFQVITAGLLRLIHPMATQTRPVNITSTLTTPHEMTIDANNAAPVARDIPTPQCAGYGEQQFDESYSSRKWQTPGKGTLRRSPAVQDEMLIMRTPLENSVNPVRYVVPIREETPHH